MSGGFYKRDGEQILCAPTFVLHADFELWRDRRDSYDYPVDGWTWYDDDDAAYAAFGLPLPPLED